MKQLFLYISVVDLCLSSACASQLVCYQDVVSPILDSRCIKCQISPAGIGYIMTGLEMDSYQSLMQGTAYGPVIIAGDSRRSMLNMLVEGRAGKLQRMPHNNEQGLTDEQIETLRAWVNQGAVNN